MKNIIKRIWIAIGVLIVLFAIYVGAIYEFVFIPSFSRKDTNEARNRKYFVTEENFKEYESCKSWFESTPHTKETMKSFDGLKLVAYNIPYTPSETSQIKEAIGTIILMHGYQSEPIREFIILAKFYNSLGYNIFMPYQRTHGESEGKFITFGVKERFDLRDWMGKVNEIYGKTKPLFVEGISMGCATTVMALGCPDLPDNLKGVIADCGFTTPREIIWKVLKYDRNAPTASLIMKIGNFFTKTLAGFDMDDYSTIEAIEFNKKRFEQIPILFIHGTKDDFVPIEMTEENFTRCIGEFSEIKGGDLGNILLNQNPQSYKYKYVRIEDSPHAISNLIDKDKYRLEVSKFLNKYNK